MVEILESAQPRYVLSDQGTQPLNNFKVCFSQIYRLQKNTAIEHNFVLVKFHRETKSAVKFFQRFRNNDHFTLTVDFMPLRFQFSILKRTSNILFKRMKNKTFFCLTSGVGWISCTDPEFH